MSPSASVKERRSLADVQADYDTGRDKSQLENLMRAWMLLQKRPAEELDSFFNLAGYHGEPFRDQGATDARYWGGCCEHGSVLFPTWHRAYLYKLEQALQSFPGCEDVTMPFWDETSPDALENGIPKALTWETFELDGETIPNPLRSFTLPVDIVDTLPNDFPLYSKPAGYVTTRYPLSGLVGTEADRAATTAHNNQFPNDDVNVGILNENIINWLNLLVPYVQPDGSTKMLGEVHSKFLRCLDAPDYTLFSNTTSAGAYNNATPKPPVPVVPLESPHNNIHLAIGGYDVPGTGPTGGHFSTIDGANGDMGENDTASMDPIFWFHHCFIDYVFWIWQQRHGATDALEINAGDPGANTSTNTSQGPPAGREFGQELTVDSPLNPFTIPGEGGDVPMTSSGVANIEALGYRYGPGSLDEYAQPPAQLREAAPPDLRTLHVSGIDRGKVRGSFLISAYANVDGEMRPLGHDAVLSRWHVEGCANCQAHLEARATFVLPDEHQDAAAADEPEVHVELHTRHGVIGGNGRGAGTVQSVGAPESPPAFKVEVR